MNIYAEQTSESKDTFSGQEATQKSTQKEATFQFVNNRSSGGKFDDYQSKANNSPQVNKVAQLQSKANDFVESKNPVIQKKENNTGLPNNLKSGMESLSGISLDDVKVHRNSDKPAQLQAHAYAQGTDIHLGPGQEKHLPHEAWHVVQQKQGRVKPTKQLKSKIAINDDDVLEREADIMGAKALQMKVDVTSNTVNLNTTLNNTSSPVQRKVFVGNTPYTKDIGTQYSAEMEEAMSDEYLRFYKDEPEAKGHIEQGVPGNFGLIKSRALWYRIPYLNDEFFVFGEYHSAITGNELKASSNTTKPIVNEEISGWNVDDMIGNNLDNDHDSGLDENSSKLYQALFMWVRKLAAQKEAQGKPPAPVPGPAPLQIPEGSSSNREEAKGTKRLIVYGEGGNAEYWKPSGADAPPPNLYNADEEMLAAIEELFEKVFAVEIANSFNTLAKGDAINYLWNKFKTKAWKQLGKSQAYNLKWNIAVYLRDAAGLKTADEYQKLYGTKHRGDLKEEQVGWFPDNYRDELMFARAIEARDSGTVAFSNMGNGHLERLRDRFIAKGIPFITVDDFFDRYSRDAVDTHEIALKNSSDYRKGFRKVILTQCLNAKYPNMDGAVISSLTYSQIGEFLLTGNIESWETNEKSAPNGGKTNQEILNLFYHDLLRVYPNAEGLTENLDRNDVGEFVATDQIAKWEQ